jgi:hypothetical protein
MHAHCKQAEQPAAKPKPFGIFLQPSLAATCHSLQAGKDVCHPALWLLLLLLLGLESS